MAKKKKGFTDYLAKTAKGMWANAKGVAKRDMGRVKSATGEVPTGGKLEYKGKGKGVEGSLHRIKDIGK